MVRAAKVGAARFQEVMSRATAAGAGIINDVVSDEDGNILVTVGSK